MSFKWAGVTFEQMSSGLFAPIMGLGGLGALFGQVTPAHQFQQQVSAQQQAMQGQMAAQYQQQVAQQMHQTFHQAYKHFQSPGLGSLFSGLMSYVMEPQAEDFDDPMDYDIALWEWRAPRGD